MNKKRVWQLDALRGLALANMLVYHFMYDWVYLFGLRAAWYDIGRTGIHVWQQAICWTFILVSGYCWHFTRRPVKHGLIVAGCAAVLTAATALLMPEQAIWFGVLHLNACAVLLTAALEKPLRRVRPAVGLTVCAALFALTNQLPYGHLGFERWHLATVTTVLYRANWFWLGLPDWARFDSADYFPLLPWLFLFWCGYFAARGARPRPAAAPAPLRGLCWLGQHTLWVYMVHQPLIYVVILLVVHVFFAG